MKNGVLPQVRQIDALESLIENAYHQLKDFLMSEHEKAKQSGKKLLILIGEHHNTHYSILVETMILRIASSYLNVKNIMVEWDNFRYYLGTTRDYYNWLRTQTWERSKGFKIIEDINHEMGGQFHLIDNIIPIPYHFFIPSIQVINWFNQKLFFSEILDEKLVSLMYEYYWPVTREGVQKRNDAMACEAIKINQDSIGIVGSSHLNGLLNETDLKKHFYIVPINANFRPLSTDPTNYYLNEQSIFARNAEVYQSDRFLPSNPGFPVQNSLNETLNIVKEVHQRAISDLPVIPNLLVQHNAQKNKKRKRNESEEKSEHKNKKFKKNPA